MYNTHCLIEIGYCISIIIACYARERAGVKGPCKACKACAVRRHSDISGVWLLLYYTEMRTERKTIRPE